MLATLQQTLKRLGAEWQEQSRLVHDLEAPKRKLAEIEQELAATEAARAKAEADETQWRAELFDCRNILSRIEPHEADLHAAIRALDALADLAERGYGDVSQYDIGRTASQCRTTLEILAARREERTRLEAQLKSLGVKP